MLAAAALNYQVVSYAGAYVSAPRADVVMGAKSKAKGVKEFRKGANKFSYIDVATGKEYVDTSSPTVAGVPRDRTAGRIRVATLQYTPLRWSCVV